MEDLCGARMHADDPATEWADDEKDILDTGILCFGTDWDMILAKYGRHFSHSRSERELRRQYYEAIWTRGLEENNIKHALVVNVYGKPICRDGEIVYFFCVDPLAELQRAAEGDPERYRDGEDVFVGTHFCSVTKIHRCRISRLDGKVCVEGVSTVHVEDKTLRHEWEHMIEAHLRRHPYDISGEGVLRREDKPLCREEEEVQVPPWRIFPVAGCPLKMENKGYSGPSSKIKLHIHTATLKRRHVVDSSVVREYSKNPRRKPTPWSPEEEEALLRGIKEVGQGRWKEILEKYRDVFKESRRHIDLSDKIRALKKQASYYYTTKINFVEVNDKGEEVSNALGQTRSYLVKFPYSAAKMVGVQKLSQGVDEAVVNIQGERNGVLTRHKYRVLRDPGHRDGIRIVKISSMVVDEAPPARTSV